MYRAHHSNGIADGNAIIPVWDLDIIMHGK